jgi:hypothetical protein
MQPGCLRTWFITAIAAAITSSRRAGSIFTSPAMISNRTPSLQAIGPTDAISYFRIAISRTPSLPA